MNVKRAVSRDLESDLVDRARGLIAVLRARAEKASQDCKVPEETIRDLQEGGFFKVLQPKRYGGYELDPEVFYDIQMTLAEGCMSTAWIYGVIAVHNWQLALFDPKAQDDVWGQDNSVLISSSYQPKATVTRVEGGYRISGRWAFSSGVDHCRWAFLGGLIPPVDGIGAPEYRTFLVPRSDFVVLPVWDTLGLRATGSHDVVVEDAFVPAYRTHKAKDGFAVTSPGLAANPAPLYKLPFGQIFVRAVSSSSIGALQAALDYFLDYAGKRVSSNDFSQSALDPMVQLIAADTAVAIDEMKLALHRNFRVLEDKTKAGQPFELEERIRFRYQSALVVDRCARLVSELFYNCGAQGVYRNSPLTRIFVDIHTGRTHIANTPDKVGRNYGGFLLGQANTDTFI